PLHGPHTGPARRDPGARPPHHAVRLRARQRRPGRAREVALRDDRARERGRRRDPREPRHRDGRAGRNGAGRRALHAHTRRAGPAGRQRPRGGWAAAVMRVRRAVNEPPAAGGRRQRRMPLRPLILVLAVLLLPLTTAAQNVPAELTLEDAVRLAREHSPAYRKALNDARVAAAQVRQSWGAFLPTL